MNLRYINDHWIKKKIETHLYENTTYFIELFPKTRNSSLVIPHMYSFNSKSKVLTI